MGFDKALIIDGDSEQKAQFGGSIVNIGDIDNDGYNGNTTDTYYW